MKEKGIVREFWDYVIAVLVFIFIAFCYVSVHDSLTTAPVQYNMGDSKENNDD